MITLFGMACPDYTVLLEEADEDEGDEDTEGEKEIEEDDEDLESS